jgi:DNA repair ATPase RecN
MSTRHKLRKYLTKLENAPLNKMDLYFEKVKKYKMAQSGGAAPWRDAIDPKIANLKQIAAVKEQLKELTEKHAGDVKDMSDKVDAIKKSSDDIYVALEDALKYLNDIASSINVEGIDTKAVGELLDSLKAINIEVTQRPTAEETWKKITETKQPQEPPQGPPTE